MHCCRQETYHTQGRGQISLVTRMQNVENSRKKYRAKGERGSFHILRTAVVDRSHRFMQWHSWSILLDSMGYRLVLNLLTGKLRKRTAKRESSLEMQRDWSIHTNKELEGDEYIMQKLAESLTQHPMRTPLSEGIVSGQHDLDHQQGKESTEAFKKHGKDVVREALFNQWVIYVYSWKGQ